MIAPLVIALLVGVSTALPSCADVQDLLLNDYLKLEKGEAAQEPVVLGNFENELTFKLLEGDDSHSAFIVQEANIENLPTLSIGTESYPLLGLAYGTLDSEIFEGAATVSVVFSSYDQEGFAIYLPLTLAENENEPGFNADLNENLSKLLALSKSSLTKTQDGISIAWLHKLLSIAPVRLTEMKADHVDIYMTDCVVVGK